MHAMSVLDWELSSTPFVVIDVETTGLSPRKDRIVEIAAVVVRPREAPKLAFETLIQPGQPMGSGEVHGLTDDDVTEAPTFADILAPLVSVLSNRVIASHNVRFDLSLLGEELMRHGHVDPFPHVCTMLMPRLIEPLGRRLSLDEACKYYGIEREQSHVAAADAMAAAHLLVRHLKRAHKQGLRTFEDLRDRTGRGYAFLESLGTRPLPSPPVMFTGKGLRPRTGPSRRRRRSKVARYLEGVLDVAADLRLDDDELTMMQELQRELDLPPDMIRAVHAKVFWGMLSRYVEDSRIDRAEASHLNDLREVLSRLGWAPGDIVAEGS